MMAFLIITVNKKNHIKIKKVLDIFLKSLYSNIGAYKQGLAGKASNLSFLTACAYNRIQKDHRLFFTQITDPGKDCVSIRYSENRHRTGSRFTGKHASGDVRS